MLSRPDCHLCEEMRREVDELLGEEPREWEVVDVNSEPDLARRFGDQVPILSINGRFFAKTRLPRLGLRFRLRRAAGLSG